MKSFLSVCLILILTRTSLFCQSDWSYVYDNNLVYDDFVALEVQNDTIYAVSANWNLDTTLFGMAFFKMDSTGHLFDTIQFYTDGQILSTFRKYSGFQIFNKTLYFYGTTNQYYTYLIKSNTDFTEDTIIYYPPNAGVNFTGATGLLATESGLYLLAQQKKPNELHDIMVIHTDLEGKELWRKVYGGANTNEIGLSLIESELSEIVIGAYKSVVNTGLPQGSEWILIIDTLGNVKKEWISADVPNRGVVNGLHLANSNFVFSSSINQYLSSTDYRRKINFCSRDSLFNLNWQTDIPSPNENWYSFVWNTTLTPDSTAIVGVGRKDYGGPGFHYKVDVQTGAIIYQRTLVGCTEEYDAIDMEFFDVACLSSGSTVACGYTVLQTPVAPAYTGWIVKTNPWGIDLMDECTTVSTGVVTQMQHTGVNIKVSPNPASGEVTIHLPEVRQEAYLRLVNLSGQVVQHQTYQSASPVLDLSDLEAGLYIVQVLDRFGNVLAAGKVVKVE